MTNTYPENEVDNWPTPANWVVITPNTNAFPDEPGNVDKERTHDGNHSMKANHQLRCTFFTSAMEQTASVMSAMLVSPQTKLARDLGSVDVLSSSSSVK